MKHACALLHGLAAVLIALVVSPAAQGHGGGLDRNGCHTNRKTGDYHCHNGSSSPAPSSTPVRRVAAEAMPVQAAPTSRERDLIRTAQVLLRALGYKPSLLGALDERTVSAVRTFQRAENVSADGLVTEYLVLRLAERVTTNCQ